jgi:hypothetical protein
LLEEVAEEIILEEVEQEDQVEVEIKDQQVLPTLEEVVVEDLNLFQEEVEDLV